MRRPRKRSDPTSISGMAERARLFRMVVASSQAGLARSLGITARAWNNYESGFSRINLDLGILLCDRYGVSLDWLFRGQEVQLSTEFKSKLREAERKLREEEGSYPAQSDSRPRKSPARS